MRSTIEHVETDTSRGSQGAFLAGRHVFFSTFVMVCVGQQGTASRISAMSNSCNQSLFSPKENTSWTCTGTHLPTVWARI